ncbi:MAG: erythromycin esterase family protein [Phycisphaerales bacterium]|nr:erythromycin esterase family protein [Phycisphaerales bacterium]
MHHPLPLAAILALTAPSFAQSPTTTLTPAQAQWLRSNAVELTTIQPGNGFADLQPLKAMIGNARIVGLGEGTHGTREHFQAKHRLVEFLVEEMGFDIFSIEANMPEAYALDDYILGGHGDVNTLISGMYFWTWNTEEVRGMVEWMRDYNARQSTAGSARRIHFTGFDMQAGAVALKIAREFLKSNDPDFAASFAPKLTQLADFTPFGAGGGYGCVTASFPIQEARNKKLKLSGWVRTGEIANGWAGLWLRIDGPNPFFDNMQNRGPRAPSDWTWYSIETTVPDDAMAVYFGLLMTGTGTSWFDGLTIELDGQPWKSPQFDLDFETAAPRGLVPADPSGGTPPPGCTYQFDPADAKVGAKSFRIQSDAQPATNSEVLAAAQSLLDHMLSKRSDYITAVGERAADWAIQNARIVHQWTGLADAERGFSHRDACMALNTTWILDQNPGSKLILWAHNWHMRDELPWMGAHLRNAHAKDYVNLAFCSWQGTYTAMGADSPGLGTHTLAAAPPDSFESMLHADGRPLLLLDLRTASPTDPGSAWLTETRPFGGIIGALQMNNHYHPAKMQGHFDLLIYTQDTTAARQLRSNKRGG